MIIFFLLIMFGISGFATWFSYKLITDGYYLYSTITIPFILLFPFSLLHYLTSKIILTDNEIVRKTPIRINRIRYSEIESFKRFESIPGNLGNTYLETNSRKSKNIFSVQQIYVSTKPNSNPNDFKKGKHILFNESEDVYNRLKEKITAANNGYK